MQNGTARSATITTPLGTETHDVGLANATELIEHSVGSEHWSIITVYDADQQPIHRSVTILSGLEVSTELKATTASRWSTTAELNGLGTCGLAMFLWFTSTRW